MLERVDARIPRDAQLDLVQLVLAAAVENSGSG